MERVQKAAILRDLQKKMVLIVGPRQAGKTWLAQDIGHSFQHSTYLNYDSVEDRGVIHREAWLGSTELLILDELHKMPEWKNYLKGLYDTKPRDLKIIVTGSARLDVFNQMGDSLAGRYFMHRLLPLSPAELSQMSQPVDLDFLMERSGFPEPFLAENNTEAKRWRQQYIHSLITTDVLEFDKVRNIQAIKLVFELLRKRVGSPISYKSIAEDVAISQNTVRKYIEILEALYIVFRVKPFSKNIARSILKEPKIYFFDTGLVGGDEGVKLENLVANCLLKHVYGKIDYEAEEYNLHYLRTKDQHEVDFALAKSGKVEQIIEVKNKRDGVGKSLISFHKKYNLPAIQIVKDLKIEQMVSGIKVIRVDNFLEALYL